MKKPILAALALTLAACETAAPTLQVAAQGLEQTAITAAAGDDRTAAARIAAGIAAGRAGVSVGCAVVNDAADLAALDGLRRYCAARR